MKSRLILVMLFFGIYILSLSVCLKITSIHTPLAYPLFISMVISVVATMLTSYGLGAIKGKKTLG